MTTPLLSTHAVNYCLVRWIHKIIIIIIESIYCFRCTSGEFGSCWNKSKLKWRKTRTSSFNTHTYSVRNAFISLRLLLEIRFIAMYPIHSCGTNTKSKMHYCLFAPFSSWIRKKRMPMDADTKWMHEQKLLKCSHRKMQFTLCENESEVQFRTEFDTSKFNEKYLKMAIKFTFDEKIPLCSLQIRIQYYKIHTPFTPLSHFSWKNKCDFSLKYFTCSEWKELDSVQ